MLSEASPVTKNDFEGDEQMSDTSNEEYEDALEEAEAERQSKCLIEETASPSATSTDSTSLGTNNNRAATECTARGSSQNPTTSNSTPISHMTNAPPVHHFREVAGVPAMDGAYNATNTGKLPPIGGFPRSSVVDQDDVDVSDGRGPVATSGYQPPQRSVEQAKTDLDLLSQIPHLFRILNLCTDTGSNGGIDKVIIDQDGLGHAMNTIREGSYRTVSRINFSALDEVSVLPIGIYGSKSAIVEFLLNLGAINSHLFVATFAQDSESLHPVLYIIYWPEDETWNDDAPTSIQKNRVTFMRYLTKLASDIRSLVSEEHASAFVWKYDGVQGDNDRAGDDRSSDDESDEDDRFVKFEVTKQSDEEEDIIPYPGFKLRDPSLACRSDQSSWVQLVAGETCQAFMVVTRHGERMESKAIKGEYNAIWLRSELLSMRMRQTTISLGKKIEKSSMDILFELGAIPAEARSIYNQYRSRAMEKEAAFLKLRNAALSAPQSKWPILKRQIEANVWRRFAGTYSILDDNASHWSSGSEEAEGHLKDVFTQAPESRSVYERSEAERVPVHIDSADYKALKKRFVDVRNDIEASSDFTAKDRHRLIASIISGEQFETAPNTGNLSIPGWNKLVEMKNATVEYLSSSSRSSSSVKKISQTSFGRDDGEFLDNLAHHGPNSEYSEAIQAINNSATTWLEAEILKRADKIAQDVQKALETSIAVRTLHEYRDEQFARCMDMVRGSLAPDPSSRALTEFTMTQLEAKADEIRVLEDDPSHVPSLSAGFTPVTRETDVDDSML
ncbi:hypothetical protein FRC01_008174 [Tulasnella sp. 417]|nr:hypothetical protein FRC01_008174 [Tulasnella sp. 417]